MEMKATLLGIGTIILISGNLANAQPLVTGDLTAYYDFDELREENFFFFVPDESGNGLDGEIGESIFHDALNDGEFDIVLDTEDSVRGAGSIAFNTEIGVANDFIAIGSCVPNFPCEVPSELVPSNAIT